jgi:integrase
VNLKRKTPGRDGIITPEIEAIILRELSGKRNRKAWLVVVTMMDTGCRPSEVFAMRLEHIDWAGGSRSLTARPRKPSAGLA